MLKSEVVDSEHLLLALFHNKEVQAVEAFRPFMEAGVTYEAIYKLLANVADVKSLVIHPATTTHSQLSARELEEQGIKPGTVRLSIGTEHIDDLLDDLSQAFDRI